MVQGILNDPVEQQLRRKSLANREQNRQSERERLIQDSLQQAQSLQQNGQYDEAIRLAEQVLALEPEDARQTQTSRQIIQNARENKHAVDLLMLEARRNLEAKNYREAQSAINQILNRAPMHAEARELQRQLTQ
jgi:tetratricopeptide (TPR) repeat protein